MRPERFRLVRFLMLAAVLLAFVEVEAAEFPAKPINLVIPFGPGGTSDLTGRGGQHSGQHTKGTSASGEVRRMRWWPR